MNYFETRLNEALDDIPEVPDEEPVWDVSEYIKNLDERDPVLERLLLSFEDGDLIEATFDYAEKFFSRIGWSELEELVKDDPGSAFHYAKHVIKGRFPEGEEAIASDSFISFEYALDVIGDEFPLGERTIARDPWLAYQYAKYVINGRFPLGEKSIVSDPWYTYWYAKDVIGGRWPEGEATIYSDPRIGQEYDNFLRKINAL